MKKLALTKETLQSLGDDNLESVAGGAMPYPWTAHNTMC